MSTTASHNLTIQLLNIFPKIVNKLLTYFKEYRLWFVDDEVLGWIGLEIGLNHIANTDKELVTDFSEFNVPCW